MTSGAWPSRKMSFQTMLYVLRIMITETSFSKDTIPSIRKKLMLRSNSERKLRRKKENKRKKKKGIARGDNLRKVPVV